MTEVSVVVPVYNVRAYLDRCVQSILGQTYRDFELLLVDDGSTDGSGDVCDQWAGRDGRVRVFHQANAGQGAARNFGVGQSVGGWIAFVDADDYVAPGYLEYLWRLRSDSRVGISMCMLVPTHGEPLEKERETIPFRIFDAPEACLRLLRGDGMMDGPVCKLFRRDLVETCPFPEGRVYEDTAVMGRLVHSAGKVAAGQAVLYGYFVNPAGTVWSREPEKMRDQLRAHREAAEFFRGAGEKRAARLAWDKLRDATMKDIKWRLLPDAELRDYWKEIGHAAGHWGLLGIKCRLALVWPAGYRLLRGGGEQTTP